MKVIILAGGKGTRLPESAADIPKPLVEIEGKTILDFQIEHLEKQGFSDIRLSLGHMAEKIKKHMKETYCDKYEWVEEPKRLGTGGGLKYASRDLEDEFMALNVDDLADIDHRKLSSHYQKHNCPATITIYEIDDAREFGLVDKKKIPHAKTHKIQGFSEKPDEKKAGEISIGTYILHPEIFEDFGEGKFSIEYDVFPVLAARGELAAFKHEGSWKTVGTEERLSEARSNGIPI